MRFKEILECSYACRINTDLVQCNVTFNYQRTILRGLVSSLRLQRIVRRIARLEQNLWILYSSNLGLMRSYRDIALFRYSLPLSVIYPL